MDSSLLYIYLSPLIFYKVLAIWIVFYVLHVYCHYFSRKLKHKLITMLNILLKYYLTVLVLFAGWWQLKKTSIIIDASKYIQELKQKVEELNQDLANAQTSTDQNTLPMVFNIIHMYMCSFRQFLLICRNFF